MTKKKKILFSVLGLVVVALGWRLIRGGNPPVFTSETVQKGLLRQSVEESGSVKSEVNLQYAFELSGRIKEVRKKNGDSVNQGEVLISMENGDQLQRYYEASAGYASAVAALTQKLSGPSTEKRAEAEASVKKAEAGVAQARAELEKIKISTAQDILNAEKNVENATIDVRNASGGQSEIVTEAYIDLRIALSAAITDAVEGLSDADGVLGIDNIFANDAFESILASKNINSIYAARANYGVAKTSLRSAQQAVQGLTASSDGTAIEAAAGLTRIALDDVLDLLGDVSDVLLSTLPTASFTQSSLDTLKATIISSRTGVSSAQNSVESAMQASAAAKNTAASYGIVLQKAERALIDVKKTAAATVQIYESALSIAEASAEQAKASFDALVNPPREVDIASLRADVSRAGAQLSAAKNDLDKTRLTSPVTGTVANVLPEPGQFVTAGEKVVTVVSSDFSIEVDISESDIAKVSLEDTVRISLDAFPGKTIFGKVISIDPGPTEISGVVYYKTTILLTDYSTLDIKSGMTADVAILTDEKDGALMVPRRAIFTKEGKSYVRVVKNEKRGVFEEREVVSGISGDGGMVEIISGLSEGERIVTFLEDKK